MSDIKAIKELALYAAKKQVPTAFEGKKSIADVNDALRAELFELCGTYKKFRQNQNTLFEIMEETMDAVVPAQVAQAIMSFADVRTYGNGDKPVFKLKKGKVRARKFATRATASGVYETFRLDSDVIPFDYFTIGDAAYIDFERFLSGDEDWADYLEALMDGMINFIYKSVNESLLTAAKTLGKYNNYAQMSGAYNAELLQKVLRNVKAYGDPVIVATGEFIDAMGPDVVEGHAPGSTKVAKVVDEDASDIHNYGRIMKYRGVPVVEIPASFEDETNSTPIFAGKYAYILPSLGEKVVKVAFEGDTVVKPWENRDNSMELQAYKKLGIAVVTAGNWAFAEITD